MNSLSNVLIQMFSHTFQNQNSDVGSSGRVIILPPELPPPCLYHAGRLVGVPPRAIEKCILYIIFLKEARSRFERGAVKYFVLLQIGFLGKAKYFILPQIKFWGLMPRRHRLRAQTSGSAIAELDLSWIDYRPPLRSGRRRFILPPLIS